MGNRLKPITSDVIYHIFNRGLNKQTLFYNASDYHRFLDTIQRYKTKYPRVQIQAYCLLPNHFHFILVDKLDSSNSRFKSDFRVRTEATTPSNLCQVSLFMQKLQQSYALYFNNTYGDSVKRGLKSPVFEGRFKAKEIVDEAYLYQLVTYVEHNAVKHEIVAHMRDWPYSSWEAGKEIDLEKDFFADFD